jgi:transglutaminase-like putative cysteine protease
MQEDWTKYLKVDEVFNFAHPAVRQFKEENAQGSTALEVAVSLYYAVRDTIWYDPFNIRFDAAELAASRILDRKRGHCVDKAILYIAVCRAAQIPARLGLARVKNHMGTARLEEVLRSSVLNPHGFVEVYIGGKWVKCTPAFNQSLCEKLHVAPLEFNGVDDSVFQEFDGAGGGYMQYLNYHGTYAAVPLDELRRHMFEEYPHLFDATGRFMAELLRG